MSTAKYSTYLVGHDKTQCPFEHVYAPHRLIGSYFRRSPIIVENVESRAKNPIAELVQLLVRMIHPIKQYSKTYLQVCAITILCRGLVKIVLPIMGYRVGKAILRASPVVIGEGYDHSNFIDGIVEFLASTGCPLRVSY